MKTKSKLLKTKQDLLNYLMNDGKPLDAEISIYIECLNDARAYVATNLLANYGDKNNEVNFIVLYEEDTY